MSKREKRQFFLLEEARSVNAEEGTKEPETYRLNTTVTLPARATYGN